MPDLILPSKLISERIEVRFNFGDELEWGEVIEAAQFSVSVVSGVDSLPTLLLYKAVSFSNTEAWQKLHKGLPGVIYKVECRVRADSGNDYVKWAHLAILPDGAQNPPILATYFSSRPYPVEAVDSLVSDSIVTRGTSNGLEDQNEYESSGWVEAAELWGGLKSAEGGPDDLTSTASVTEGSLFGGLISAEGGPDDLTSSAWVVDGTLFNQLVSHVQPPEDFLTSGASITAGTLT